MICRTTTPEERVCMWNYWIECNMVVECMICLHVLVAYLTPIWHKKICMSTPENGWLLLAKRLTDRSASDFFPHAVSMAQKTSQTTLTEPPYVPQLGLGHDQRGGTATNRERNINVSLQLWRNSRWHCFIWWSHQNACKFFIYFGIEILRSGLLRSSAPS